MTYETKLENPANIEKMVESFKDLGYQVQADKASITVRDNKNRIVLYASRQGANWVVRVIL